MFPDLYTIRRVREGQVKEWLREAERDRLARLALAGRQGSGRFHCRMLAGLGRWMVAWGVRLQERYGVAIEMPRTLGGSPQPGGR
jgi:hypothetical protein